MMKIIETLEEQLAAVQWDGHAIEFIENPSPEVQLSAVHEYEPAIQFIKNPHQTVLDYVSTLEVMEA